MRFKKNSTYYLLIVGYSLLMVVLMTGVGRIFGSHVDWYSQHVVFPDLFRDNFYKTGNIIPEFFFNIGAGQNGFNFAYYGLLSPIILVSYLLPFVPMMTYIIIASIILFALKR